jgi:hypothetical protein
MVKFSAAGPTSIGFPNQIRHNSQLGSTFVDALTGWAGTVPAPSS